MPLTKQQKEKVTEELSDKIKKANVLVFTDFHGVSVAKSQALRRTLRKNDAEYKVSKKTLINRALSDSGIELNAKELKGEMGLAFGYGDEVAPAKDLLKFSKENETFKILGGILKGRILGEKEVLALARLPSKEVLLGQVVGAFVSPIRGLVNVLQGNIRNLVVVLNQIKDKK